MVHTVGPRRGKTLRDGARRGVDSVVHYTGAVVRSRQAFVSAAKDLHLSQSSVVSIREERMLRAESDSPLDGFQHVKGWRCVGFQTNRIMLIPLRWRGAEGMPVTPYEPVCLEVGQGAGGVAARCDPDRNPATRIRRVEVGYEYIGSVFPDIPISWSAAPYLVSSDGKRPSLGAMAGAARRVEAARRREPSSSGSSSSSASSSPSSPRPQRKRQQRRDDGAEQSLAARYAGLKEGIELFRLQDMRSVNVAASFQDAATASRHGIFRPVTAGLLESGSAIAPEHATAAAASPPIPAPAGPTSAAIAVPQQCAYGGISCVGDDRAKAFFADGCNLCVECCVGRLRVTCTSPLHHGVALGRRGR
eukprot:TRINITY_DN2087_c0_g1_i1.p2 TRINITY_DN2087_c0_g1~~TRINITY_DN2087_c0_g1_i1.p2  ORF type:complete len:394 (+),score=37.28 TRINITY_DN2087_c0_g1_i1:100-1182(+)